MALFYIPLGPGTYETGTSPTAQVGDFNTELNHQMSFTASASSPPVTAGTITVFARSPGSQAFEAVPGGVIDLSAPRTLLFQFLAERYLFTVEGTTDTGLISITDRAFGGVQ